MIWRHPKKVNARTLVVWGFWQKWSVLCTFDGFRGKELLWKVTREIQKSRLVSAFTLSWIRLVLDLFYSDLGKNVLSAKRWTNPFRGSKIEEWILNSPEWQLLKLVERIVFCAIWGGKTLDSLNSHRCVPKAKRETKQDLPPEPFVITPRTQFTIDDPQLALLLTLTTNTGQELQNIWGFCQVILWTSHYAFIPCFLISLSSNWRIATWLI